VCGCLYVGVWCVLTRGGCGGGVSFGWVLVLLFRFVLVLVVG